MEKIEREKKTTNRKESFRFLRSNMYNKLQRCYRFYSFIVGIRNEILSLTTYNMYALNSSWALLCQLMLQFLKSLNLTSLPLFVVSFFLFFFWCPSDQFFEYLHFFEKSFHFLISINSFGKGKIELIQFCYCDFQGIHDLNGNCCRNLEMEKMWHEMTRIFEKLPNKQFFFYVRILK